MPIMDDEARTAIWIAIRHAAASLAGQCTFYLSRTPDRESIVGRASFPPNLPTWRLVEALSLIMILVKTERVNCADVFNLMGRTGPINFAEDGKDRYL